MVPKTSRSHRPVNVRNVEDAMESRNEKLNGVLLFAAGSLIGAAVALLLAPQSGKKTRRDIVHLGKMAKAKSEQIQLEMRHAVDNLVDDISEKMQEGMDRGREWTETTTHGVLQALNSGKDYIRRELDNVISRRA
jgi:gas vesicle protein